MFDFFRKNKQEILKQGKDVLQAFQQSRKKLLRLSLTSLGLTFVALAIVGTKLFYPFHMVIGVGIYILSFYSTRKAHIFITQSLEGV